MINFENELGYPYWDKTPLLKYHRYRSNEAAYSICHHQLLLWDIKDHRILLFNDICKKCLSTFSAEEIEDLKQFLVLRKLRIKK